MIAPLGLRLAPEKTRVVHIDEGFDFLGFHIRRMRKRGTNKHYVYTTPSRKSVQKIRDTVRDKTHRSTRNGDLDELIDQLEPVPAGVGELLSARGVQGDIQRDRQPRLAAAGRLDPPQTPPDQPKAAPTPLLRPGLADRPQRGRVHRRLQRRRDPLPLPRREHPDPLDRQPPPAVEQRARHVESRMRGDAHVRFGGRARLCPEFTRTEGVSAGTRGCSTVEG